MKDLGRDKQLNRGAVCAFSMGLIIAGFNLIKLALLKSKDWEGLSFAFAELYSSLWDHAEHSISHQGFSLPTALGDGPVHKINRLLTKIYGGKFAGISMGGSSGALITLLTAVLPKLQPERDLVLFDDMCHQSAIGGVIFGRWKAVRLQRSFDPKLQTVRPLTFELIEKTIQDHGASRIAAILIVTPSYDGFSSPSENAKIYALAKSLGIIVIIDGAWDSLRFQNPSPTTPALESLCDVWISSPHKRGLTPSSLGCVITQHEAIAKLWDEAQDLGFRSSSISFVNIMIAEHRLDQVLNGNWDTAFAQARKSANIIRKYIPEINPDLCIIDPKDVCAETTDSAHILISTHRLPHFDARRWAHSLSSDFGLDVEKATRSTLLLLCASPAHFYQMDHIKRILKDSFYLTLSKSDVAHVS